MNTRPVAALVGVLVALTGCAITADDAARDIEGPAVVDAAEADPSTGAAAIGAGRIYLLAADQRGVPSRLEAVARDVADDPVVILRALFAGPNTQEFAAQLRTALPPDLTLNSARVRSSGILVVDVTEALLELSSDALIGAVAQIVFTASTIDDVRSVQITVNGARSRWPASNGELQERPLTVYDYPGFEASAQPAYPAVPSAG